MTAGVYVVGRGVRGALLCAVSLLPGCPPDPSVRSAGLCLPGHALTVTLLAQALTALSVVLAVAWATHFYAPAAAKKVYLLDTFTYKPPDRCGCATCAR